MTIMMVMMCDRPREQMACRCCSSKDNFISAAIAGPGWSSIGPDAYALTQFLQLYNDTEA